MYGRFNMYFFLQPNAATTKYVLAPMLKNPSTFVFTQKTRSVDTSSSMGLKPSGKYTQ